MGLRRPLHGTLMVTHLVVPATCTTVRQGRKHSGMFVCLSLLVVIRDCDARECVCISLCMMMVP